jgi:hypothetical protein
MDGIRFDSQFECKIYAELKLLYGKAVECQPKVYLTRSKILFKPDFKVGNTYHEAKGYETASYRLKRRLWACYGPGPLIIHFISGETETVVPST